MQWIVAASLLLAWLLLSWLHGGLYFASLNWPFAILVALAALVAAARQIAGPSLPSRSSAIWGWGFLGALALYGAVWWEALGAPANGFLPVLNLVTGWLACGAILWGTAPQNARFLIAVGIIAGAAVHFAQMMLHREGLTPLPTFWPAELMRLWHESTWEPRLSGFYINRNHLAWTLNAGCLMALALAFWARLHAGLKFVFLWVSGLLGVGTLLALSRGGALGLGGGILAFLIGSLVCLSFARGPGKRPVLILLAILTTALLAVLGWLIAGDALVQERLGRVREDFYRSQTWQSGWRQWQLSPVFGTGPGTPTDYARILRPPGIAPNEPIYLHNDWLELLASGGLVGVALAVAVFVAFLSAAVGSGTARLRARPGISFPQSTETALALGAASCLVAFAVHSFFDFNLQLGANSLLAFIVLGLAAGAPGHRPPSRPAGWRSAAVLTVGAAASLVWMWQPCEADWARVRLTNAMLRGQVWWDEKLAASLEKPGRGRDAWWLEAGNYWMRQWQSNPARQESYLLLANATRFFDKATAANPRDRFPQLQLAWARAAAGGWYFSYIEAVAGLELDPLSGLPYEVLGGVREAFFDYGMARRCYELALRFRPSEFARQRLQAFSQMEQTGKIPSGLGLSVWRPATPQAAMENPGQSR